MPYIATWTLLSRNASLARSSQCLSILSSGHAVLYGGEFSPRTPVDDNLSGAIHGFTLDGVNESPSPTWRTFTSSASDVPAPRVGAATATIKDDMYLWGGRGGKEMTPLSGHQTGVWRLRLSPGEAQWDRIYAINEDEAPVPRSYHSITSFEGKLYVHAGCPEKGRLGTLHSFDISTRTWKQHDSISSAPEPARGGTTLISSTWNGKSQLLRLGGFAGFELPSESIDIFDIDSGIWSTITPTPDPTHGAPGPRSVHGLINAAGSKDIIAIAFYGEKAPSSKGHEGAGQFWDDIWALVKVPKENSSPGVAWQKMEVRGSAPTARGWFASDCLKIDGRVKVLMHGGLLEGNQRSGELWALDVIEEA